VRGLKHKNVAAELLEKLLRDELKVRSKRNLVQSHVFSEKLKKTLNAYHNRAISTPCSRRRSFCVRSGCSLGTSGADREC